MIRSLFRFSVVFFVAALATLQAQDTAQGPSVPAASRTEAECSGFIAAGPEISSSVYILDGEDNYLHESARQFSTGDIIYLRSRTGETFTAGTEYRILRPGWDLFRASWYPGQKGSIRSLGNPVEDVGSVKVFDVTPFGALAEVTFVCTGIMVNDIAVPYQPRAIPEYVHSTQLDRWARPNGKLVGAITAGESGSGMLATGRMAHINLGESDGARPGQRFRIFRIFREQLSKGLHAIEESPRETVGELVILSTQEKSSVVKIINSKQEVNLGDGVELE